MTPIQHRSSGTEAALCRPPSNVQRSMTYGSPWNTLIPTVNCLFLQSPFHSGRAIGKWLGAQKTLYGLKSAKLRDVFLTQLYS